jgi:hypothetical protein
LLTLRKSGLFFDHLLTILNDLADALNTQCRNDCSSAVPMKNIKIAQKQLDE